MLSFELALDDVDRHTLAGKLDRVRVAQLMWGEAAANPGLGREYPEFPTDGRRCPRATASRAFDDAQQRPDRQLNPLL